MDAKLKETRDLLKKKGFTDFVYYKPYKGGPFVPVSNEIVSFSCKKDGVTYGIYQENGRIRISRDITAECIEFLIK